MKTTRCVLTLIRTSATVVAVVAAVAVTGCSKSTKLEKMYCAGGVHYDGHSMGGECLDVSLTDKPDTDPGTIGRAVLVGGPFPESGGYPYYAIRRVPKTKTSYQLFLNNELAGTLEQTDTWVRVVFLKDGRTYSLRSDPPGFLN